jgi:transposase
MSVPLPIELRERIVAAVAGGMSWAEAASVFRVGRATVNRYVRLMRQCGSVAPRPHAGGHAFVISEQDLATLRAVVATRPDATIAQIRDRYCEQTGTRVSVSTVGRALRERLGLSLKKRLSSTPSKRVSGSRKRGSRSAMR